MKSVKQVQQKGFTLLEVIVAFTILGLMAAMVFSGLRFALNAYQRSQVRIEAAARERVLLDHIRRQLASLYPLRPTAAFAQSALTGDVAESAPQIVPFPLFYGQFDTVTFVSVAPLILDNSPGLTIVRYGLAEDEFGEYYLGAMETRFSGIDSFNMMTASPQGKPLEIVDDIEDLGFEYYGLDPVSQTYQWFSAWDGQEMLSAPRAVRLRFNESELIVQIKADTGGIAQPGVQNLFQRSQ